jgi:ABC-type phosphate/phosphonate transport system substrate-binding protein
VSVRLRCRTWLSPGLPVELFQTVVASLEHAGFAPELTMETATSGPPPGAGDPFASGEVDLGFICAPSYRALAAAHPSSVALVGVAPVFDDPRNEGRPVYFSELVVADRCQATSLRELAGCRFGYNDLASQSGYRSLLDRLASLGLSERHLGELVLTGGHRRSLDALRDGTIDAAAIDSNTLLGLGGPPPGTRVVETWGPFPVQPVVVAATLDDAAVATIRSTLLALPPAVLAPFGVTRFAPVTPSDYA